MRARPTSYGSFSGDSPRLDGGAGTGLNNGHDPNNHTDQHLTQTSHLTSPLPVPFGGCQESHRTSPLPNQASLAGGRTPGRFSVRPPLAFGKSLLMRSQEVVARSLKDNGYRAARLINLPFFKDDMTQSPPSSSDVEDMRYDRVDVESLLLDVAAAGLTFGAPVHLIKFYVHLIGARYGQAAYISCTSSTLFLSFPPATNAHMVHTEEPGFSLSRIVAVTRICEDAVTTLTDPRSVSTRLRDLLQRPPLYSAVLSFVCLCLIPLCFSPLFGVGMVDLPVTLGLGLVAAVISTTQNRGVHLSRGRDMILGVVVTFLATLVNRYMFISVMPVAMSCIAWRLPGFSIVLALNDLATGNLLPGTTKLVSSLLACLNLGFGILVGLASNQFIKGEIAHADLPPLPFELTLVSLLFTAGLMVVLLDADRSHFPQLALSAGLGFYCSFSLQSLGAPLAAFVAAMVVGLAGNLYGRLTLNPAVEFVFFGIMLLVPGSVGVKSVLSQEAQEAQALLYTVIAVALAIVTGIFAASLILPPRRAV